MVAFKGIMKRYVLKKPVKRGLKIWVCADNHNGYICHFECYTRRKGGTTEMARWCRFYMSNERSGGETSPHLHG